MNIFFISDSHFAHSNILTFLNQDGSNLRTFESVEHMDEHMVHCWNKTVSPNDKVYHLGDVCMSKKHLPILARLNGEKVLVKGNHDKEKLNEYTKYFKDVRGSHQFDGLIMTHIPIHPASLARWGLNVHGHTHSNSVMRDHTTNPSKPQIRDPRYFCVSVEQINYTPISLEQVKQEAKKRLELYNSL